MSDKTKPKPKCGHCYAPASVNKVLRRGWNNDTFCSERCERAEISDLHESMPGAGPVPRYNWVPSHVSREISNRWEDAS